MEILHLDQNGNPLPVFSPNTKTANATLKADGTVASAQTALVSATARTTVRLWASADCYIAIDTNPVATNTDIPLTAKMPEHFTIEPGCKIAVLGAVLFATKHKA